MWVGVGGAPTVRVADGEPGDELQVDFGKMGRIVDPGTGRQRVCHALIFTPVVSRYSFVWLTHRQTRRGCDRRVRGGVGGSSAACSPR